MRTTLAAEGNVMAGKQASPPKPPTSRKNEKRTAPFPEWAETAWRMWCRGQRNWTELGKQFGVERRTVQSVVRKFAQAVVAAADEDVLDAYMETVIAYEEIISVAWQNHAACKDNLNAKAAFLARVESTVEKLAALRGVATQRVVIEHEMPKPLDDQPLELLVRIAQNGDGYAEEDS